MDMFDRFKESVNKGMAVSREMLGKARDKAQELGEKGVLKLEIMQLEDQVNKLITKLGLRAYEAFKSDASAVLSSSDSETAEILREIDERKRMAEEKQAQLKT